MFDNYLFFICVAAVMTLLVWGAMQLFFGVAGQRLRQRLSAEAMEMPSAQPPKRTSGRVAIKDLFLKLGQAAAKPFMPDTREKQSALRRKLARAGIYDTASVRMVTGFKVILLAGGVLGGYVVGSMLDNVWLGVSVGGLAGYLGPTLWLKLKIKANQRALDYALPDALDLMVVCVEAGLAIDAAMQRVGQELALAHKALSRELDITHMETRVGVARADALRNLGTRTGNDALKSLASMMIQADRFGTSIGGALRVHAESMRMSRQNKAEESAAKASVKLSFPLVLFIFPATFIVLAGPTVVKLLDSPLMK